MVDPAAKTVVNNRWAFVSWYYLALRVSHLVQDAALSRAVAGTPVVENSTRTGG